MLCLHFNPTSSSCDANLGQLKMVRIGLLALPGVLMLRQCALIFCSVLWFLCGYCLGEDVLSGLSHIQTPVPPQMRDTLTSLWAWCSVSRKFSTDLPDGGNEDLV